MSTSAEFFNVQPVEQALDSLLQVWKPQPKSEIIPTQNAFGRILFQAIFSPIDLPEFRRSTVDGYAVQAHDTYGASSSLPAYLHCVGAVAMGQVATHTLQQGETIEIHTGGMLPENADAVVMIERTQTLANNEIEILSPVASGENVIQIGEDVRQGEQILPAGKQIQAQDIGGLLAVGITEIAVQQPPKVGILSSGDELVAPTETPQYGQIRDINAYTLQALVQQAGGEPIHLGIARDDLQDYQQRAQTALAHCDMLIFTAGSSVSVRDLTREVISNLGRPGVLQHGLAVKPGKPTLLAVCDNKPVIGLPGNPVSALLVARQIIVPLIRHRLRQQPVYPMSISATLTQNIPSQTGRNDTVPVKLHEENGQLYVTPIFGKSNLIFTLIQADGLVYVPLNSNGLREGLLVAVYAF